MIKAGIVGGSGYAGLELIRLLQQHKHVELEVVTSRVDKGKSLEQLHPGLLGKTSLKVTNFGDPELSNCHVVFLRRLPALLCQRHRDSYRMA